MYAHVYDVAICYNRLLVSDGLATPGSALKCSVKSVKNGRLASQTISVSCGYSCLFHLLTAQFHLSRLQISPVLVLCSVTGQRCA